MVKKTALKLALDKDLLNIWFNKYPSSHLLFNNNKSLIDMTDIPKYMQYNIQSRVKICLGIANI